MPIVISGRRFSTFEDAVIYCMHSKGMTRAQAERYVGAIESKQQG